MNTNFFADLITRFGKSNPTFFKYIQLAALVLGGLSAGLSFIDGHANSLPSWLSWIESSQVWGSSIVAAILAQLPNKDVNTLSKK